MQSTSMLCAVRCGGQMTEREAILLVRLDGIGDAALCVPALEGLRRAFPDAAFGAVCSRANAALFSNVISRIHVYDPAQPEVSLRDELAEGAYTRALIATEEVAGYKLGSLSGAKRRAGFWHGLQKPFKSLWQRSQLTDPVYRPAAWVNRPEHEVVTMYRLAAVLGAHDPVPCEASALHAWLNAQASAASEVATGALGFQITPKLLTGGWGPTALARLVTTAFESSGSRRAVLVASARDEALACSVLENVPAALRVAGRIRLVCDLALPQWLGVLGSVTALVTPDTGAAHVAGMQGLAVVDLFDEDGFERLSQQWHPWAGAHRCLAKPPWRAGVESTFGQRIGHALLEVT